MAKQKYSYFIGVLTEDGVKFVTSINYDNKMALWESGKEAKEFPMTLADDIVQGLLFNFIYAFTVKVPKGITFHNGKETTK